MTLFAQTMAGFSVILGLGLTAAPVGAQVEVTTPEEAFGFQIGADYQRAPYAQLTGYWQTLARESDRMRLESIGQTAEGRDQWMAIITSPENHRLLDRYQEIAQRLARAEGLSDDEARTLAAEGKAVVWIDGGLHATEVLGAQQLIELVFQMVSATDPETLRFLDDVILLAVHCNPDGHDLVADWYLREPDPEQRTTRGLPRLYQKYVGHDNNRDFYM
ncbi:MAG: M14 family zinc carboxypeptidase, partial [Acidobacteriota bacterium]|nr:M14 family zinc carboxypeptidase [Acidobacteriota bacterium]